MDGTIKSRQICVDARMATNSGIGTYIRNLILRLAKQLPISLLIDQKTLQCCPELSLCECILTEAPLYSLQEQWTLPRLIPSCDLFWSPHFNIPLLPIKARKRLVTIHDVFFLAYKNQLAFHKQTYARVFFSQAVKRSDHVITVSHFSLSEIVKYIGPYQDKITPIHLGVDFSKFCERGKVEPEKKYILYVGNFASHKNLCRLIVALDFLPPDVHLVLVGKQLRWDAWKEFAEKRRSQITILGKVSDLELVQLYQGATALIHPSLYEGFGLTPLEAMGVGCPVVVSCAASLPEVCGDAAVYVDPQSPKAIAAGIASVWQSPILQETLRQKGLARASQFSWEKSVERHFDVIAKML